VLSAYNYNSKSWTILSNLAHVQVSAHHYRALPPDYPRSGRLSPGICQNSASMGKSRVSYTRKNPRQPTSIQSPTAKKFQLLQKTCPHPSRIFSPLAPIPPLPHRTPIQISFNPNYPPTRYTRPE